jgi:hypothetical protein
VKNDRKMYADNYIVTQTDSLLICIGFQSAVEMCIGKRVAAVRVEFSGLFTKI